MQLIAGCVGRAYNRRKRRQGAFWEDCYHATAVDTDDHLARCVTYIDLNMVRAGVVDHPRHWAEAGYHEIQQPPARYRIIDREALCGLLGTADEKLAALQNQWIEATLARGGAAREPQWSEAVAGRATILRGTRPRRTRYTGVAPPRAGRQRRLGPARSRDALQASFRRPNGSSKPDPTRRFERVVSRIQLVAMVRPPRLYRPLPWDTMSMPIRRPSVSVRRVSTLTSSASST